MINSKKLSPEDIRKGQEKIKEEIYARAKELGISTDDLWPLPDGVFNIEGYCQSSPRIMWILKQPYDDDLRLTYLVGYPRTSAPEPKFMVLSIMMMLSRIQLGNLLSIVSLAYVIINFMVIAMCHIFVMISLWLIC